MRTVGIILIIVGIIMLVTKGFDFRKKEKVAELGPVEINKEETKHVGWSTYVSGAVIVAGIVLVVVDRKKK
jgi:drug/metabolite transporter (DMT)-like permease